jgi:hypothetical protein
MTLSMSFMPAFMLPACRSVEMVSGQKPSAVIGAATRHVKLALPWPTSKRTPRVRPSDSPELARPVGASSPRRPE